MVQKIIRPSLDTTTVQDAIDSAFAALNLTPGGIGAEPAGAVQSAIAAHLLAENPHKAATPEDVKTEIADLSLPFIKSYEFNIAFELHWSLVINTQNSNWAGYYLKVSGGCHVAGHGLASFNISALCYRWGTNPIQFNIIGQHYFGFGSRVISLLSHPLGIEIRINRIAPLNGRLGVYFVGSGFPALPPVEASAGLVGP